MDLRRRLLRRSRRNRRGCWIWQGATTKSGGCHGAARRLRGSGSGYAVVWVDGKTRRASRVSYEAFVGPIPEDRPFILHACDNRKCVNPLHLTPGTHEKNMQDCKAKGRIRNQSTGRIVKCY